MPTIEIYFRDLKRDVQKHILQKLKTTEKEENFDIVPLIVLEYDEYE